MATCSSLLPGTHYSSSLKRKRPLNIQIPDVLQEIQAPKLHDSKALKDNVSLSGIGFGVFSVKGKKSCMEDAHKIVSSLESNPKKGFFGVYDGHGGRKAAEFVVENLHANILEMVGNCEESRAKREAVKAGYLKTDEEFLKKGIGSGACCVTALIHGEEIVVSNVGDCRAVLCRSGVAEVLTRDHRAELEDERRRIEEKGGYVEIHRGAWRVHGVLSVSRSIGDAHLKQWVVAEPDTKILQLTADMEFLVLASDGLWEEVSNQEAVDTVTRFLRNEEKICSLEDVQNDIDADYGQVNVSPSSKLRRVSLVKQSRGNRRNLNGWNEVGEDDFGCENESPPSKSRRISLVKRVSMKKETSVKESNMCKKSTASKLLVACKELVNLAMKRGALDDITVMIIDLIHYKRST
ncbi:probable protein phosphatase 2C 14 [Neltuma alba]|uniref:probable protein phosphatase 2C 14 n=1 Tax=Neltuma alba TaxID=207710 RepID=UPI0010A443C1|nr:probable protein phosphatase 2C 14 [Prosopis alba]